MLLGLTIENFALIKNVSVSFEKGFNILSGETGAGKSILIDSITYVLGGKFNKDLIRTGETKTFVEAVFTIENIKTKEILEELEIEFDDLVIISRETYSSGKSVTKINNKSVILSVLKKVSDTLIEIHGQHNNQSLLDRSCHIKFLDSYGDENLKTLMNEYKKNYYNIMSINKKIASLEGDDDREKILEFLKFQIKDIEDASLKNDEEEELEERFTILRNAEKISKALNTSHNLLNSSENGESILDGLSYIQKELSSIQNYSEKLQKLNSKVDDIFYNLEDISGEIRDLCEETVFDENELSEINGRLYKISALKKKYGNSISNILEYRDSIKKKYEEMINAEEILENLREELLKKEREAIVIGEKITKERKNLAKKLQDKILKELKFIGLEKCRFEINIHRADKILEDGIDEVYFIISTNPGEPLRALDKIVSGGELSRIMLALKTAFIDKDKIPSVVFDEIDTGISGRIAQAVGEKMYEISKRHQVFCITHLPQIAALSDNHYLVSKKVKDNLTFSEVKKIDLDTKTYEIAKMIGGAVVTKTTSENAKEMISFASDKKNKISNHT